MGEERLEYIRHAAAVLCPIQWEEPFGRVMAEAMACGTPVVAFRRGAAEEVIRNGVTGFVVDTLGELIDAVRHIHEIRPEACREHVRQHLHMERVARDYLVIYTEVSGR
jgi:glycosyltransferase involved in cell wall biosynthesis